MAVITNNQEKLLTPDEIRNILDACQNPRDSSLIAILSESGCRLSEALNLNINDLSKTDSGFKIRIGENLMNPTVARDIALISYCERGIVNFLISLGGKEMSMQLQ